MLHLLKKENAATVARVKEIYNTYHLRLVVFAQKMLGDRQEAEDVVQDTFLKFWNKLESVTNPGEGTKSFLYKAVKNASLNVIRHRHHVRAHLAIQDSNPSEDILFQNILKAEVLAELYKAIESLPEFCQNVSRMGFLEGKRNQEIADELGVSIDCVKAQKQRSKKLLRLALDPELFALLLALCAKH